MYLGLLRNILVLRLIIVNWLRLVFNWSWLMTRVLLDKRNFILLRSLLLNLLVLRNVNVVDWSPVNINNFSIANRDSHELVSVPDD